MIFFKTKSQKIARALEKFPLYIQTIKNDINKSKFTDLKDLSVCLDALEQNYNRLVERYKFNEQKLTQILSDSFNYGEILKETLFERESIEPRGEIDYSNFDALILKQQEIDLRFKNLLGEQYVDHIKLIGISK